MRNIHQHIIDKCLLGDERAQLELYGLYAQAMYGTCYRMVGNAQDAQDVMQNAFIKAFNKLDTYGRELAFGAWLKRIMINQSLDFLRKTRLEVMDMAQMQDVIDDDCSSSCIDVDMDELKQAMLMLPEKQRLVLNLFLLEGYDHDEIADILNTSASNSAVLLNRAKNKLRKLITAEQLMAQ